MKAVRLALALGLCLSLSTTGLAAEPAKDAATEPLVSAKVRQLLQDRDYAAALLDIARGYIHRERYEDAVPPLRRLMDEPRFRERKHVPEAWQLLG
jgi:hypothetical protein